MSDTTCTCGHAHTMHRVGRCQSRTGGVLGFPATALPCGCHRYENAAELEAIRDASDALWIADPAAALAVLEAHLGSAA